MKKNILKVLAMLFMVVGIYGVISGYNFSIAGLNNNYDAELDGGNDSGGSTGDTEEKEEHKHEIIYKKVDSLCHRLECSECDYKSPEIKHVYNSNCTCICGATNHSYKYAPDSGSPTDAGHPGKCSECGKAERVDHNDIVVDKDEEYHYYKCDICKWTYRQSIGKSEKHNFINGKCTVCDYEKNVHVHEYEYDPLQKITDFVHGVKCSTCGEKSTSNHIFTVYDFDSEYHYLSCSECELIYPHTNKGAVKHYVVNDKCSSADIGCGYPPKEHLHYFSSVNKKCEVDGCAEMLTVKSFGDAIGALPDRGSYGVMNGRNWDHIALGIATIEMSHIPYSDAEGKSYLNMKLNINKFNHGNYSAHANKFAESLNYKYTWAESNKTKMFSEWTGIFRPWLHTGSISVTGKANGDNTYTVDCSSIMGHNWIYSATIGDNGVRLPNDGKLFVRGGTPIIEDNGSVLVAYRLITGEKVEKIENAPEDDTRTLILGKDYLVEHEIDKIEAEGKYKYIGYINGTPDEVPEDLSNPTKGKDVIVNTDYGKNQHVVFIFEQTTPEEKADIVIAYRTKDGDRVTGAPDDEFQNENDITIGKEFTIKNKITEIEAQGKYKYVGYKTGNSSEVPTDLSSNIKNGKTVKVTLKDGDKKHVVFVFEEILPPQIPEEADIVIAYRTKDGDRITGAPKDKYYDESNITLGEEFKIENKISTIEALGKYKYVGYKTGSPAEVPTNLKSNIQSGKPSGITVNNGDKLHIVFIFEEPTIPEKGRVLVAYRQENGKTISYASGDELMPLELNVNYSIENSIDAIEAAGEYKYIGYKKGTPDKCPTGKLTPDSTGKSVTVNTKDGLAQHVVFIFKKINPDPISILVAYREEGGSTIDIAPYDEYYNENIIPKNKDYTIENVIAEIEESSEYEYIGYKKGTPDECPTGKLTPDSTEESVVVNSKNGNKQYVVFIFRHPTPPPVEEIDPSVVIGYRDIYSNKISGAPTDELLNKKKIGEDNKYTYEVTTNIVGYKYVGYTLGIPDKIPDKIEAYNREKKTSFEIDTSIEKKQHLVLIFEPVLIVGYRDRYGEIIEGIPESLKDTIYGASELRTLYKPNEEALKKLGYTYVGYKNGNGTSIPNEDYKKINSKNEFKISELKKPEYLVFIFEPAIIVGYRDSNGNKIEGAPEDVQYGASEIKNPHKPDLKTLDFLYYRYKGYEIGDGLNIPKSFGTLTDSESCNIPKITKPKYLVYVFEPIKITVKHLEKFADGTTQLITDGGVAFIHENILLKDAIAEGKNVSLDKQWYPLYTLLNHTLKNKDRNIATKKYDLEGMYDLTKYDLNKTTTINNVQKANELGSEVHKKLIEIIKDPKEKVGYRSDYVLEFVYNRLKLNVEHLIFEALPEDVFLKDVTGSAILAYQTYYNGQTIEALQGQGTNTLNEIKKTYDITGRYLRKMVLKANNKSKDVVFIINETISVAGALYQITTINGTFGDEVNSWLAAEQAKTGSITVKFYYEKIPTLVVKHEDKNGSKILPNEYIPMLSKITEAESKDLTGWGFDYIEYKSDGKKEVSSEIISEDPRKEKVEVGRVYVGNEPQDREVIFVYVMDGYDFVDKELPGESETKESVILRSNKRDDEEYNVDIAIPTSEDLYANVITDAFLLDRKITNIEKTETIKVTLVSENGIPCKPFDVVLKYKYLGVKDVVLKVLDKAIVKNDVLKESIEIPAKYKNGYKHPKLEYVEGGILAEESFDNEKFSNPVKLDGIWNVEFKIGNVNDEAEMEQLTKSYQEDPTYLMEHITIPTDKLYVKYNNENIKVMNRVFLPILGDYGVTDKVTYYTNAGKKDVDLSEEIDTVLKSKLVNKDVLYANQYPSNDSNKEGIYVKIEASNKSYPTYADIYYKDYQKLEGNKITDLVLTSQESKLVKENVQGNDVVVHTPVVNKTKVSSLYSDSKNDNQYDQWVTRDDYENKDGAVATLVLGKYFTLTIPHEGDHLDYLGYGNKKNYNYKGLINKENEEINKDMNNDHDHFAMGRDVKFSFGVIRCDKSKKIVGEYIAPNTWIKLESEEIGYKLSDESFNFIIPEWEEERWYSGKHTIETRVFAENCPKDVVKKYFGKGNLGDSAKRAYNNLNKEKVQYIAKDKIYVNVIGEIMDLEFRTTNDPGWAEVNTSIANGDLPLGQAGQNVNKGYKTGIKLGYTAYFDITTTGWTGDTTDSIKIVPKYYYVKKGESKPEPTKLYYKPTPSSGYVELSENPIQLTTIMNQDCYKGRNYVSVFARYIANSGGKFAMDAGRELSNTARILSGGSTLSSETLIGKEGDGRTLVNYSSIIKTGTSSEIRLPYSTRLVYQRAIEALDEKYGMELPKVAGTDYCIGHWYGALRLPGTTTTNPNNPGSDDGYIVVTFEGIISQIDGPNGPIDYLKGTPKNINVPLNPIDVPTPETQETPETTPDDITAPDDTPLERPEPEEEIPVIIYETIPGRVDNEIAGTH